MNAPELSICLSEVKTAWNRCLPWLAPPLFTFWHENKYAPISPTIYFLMYRGKIAYIGRSNRVGRRIDAHRRDRRPFDVAVLAQHLPNEQLPKIESALIALWRPEQNRAGKRRRPHDVLPLKSRPLQRRAHVPPEARREFPAFQRYIARFLEGK